MISIDAWAIKHGISKIAIDDFKNQMGLIDTGPSAITIASSEAAIQNQVRLEASNVGARLWRNNVGAYNPNYPPSPGTRWGLCNESKQMNLIIKSPDLVGIKPLLITPDLVGCVIGQFLAREVKKSHWQFTGNEHETAQLNCLNLMWSLGADAAFCNDVGSLS